MEHGKHRWNAVHTAGYQYLLRLLREARRHAGLTQVHVAKAFGRPLSFVTKCELGERRIDPVDLLHFSKLYRKPLLVFPAAGPPALGAG